MAFWSTRPEKGVNPKQKSRFIVKIGDTRLTNIKTVSKPTYTVENKSYTLLNHKFKYPGIPNWEPVTLTFVDSGGSNENATENLLHRMIIQSGYNIPTATETRTLGNREDALISTPEKASTAANSFYSVIAGDTSLAVGGTIEISQLDADGNERDTWELFGPIIKSINFGDLSYESDDLVEYTLEVEYDYAVYTKKQ